LGMEAGDIALALRAQIGEANNLWIRGDVPAAKRRLNAVARRARQSCPMVLPRVVLAIAGVANASGEYERAIYLAFGLLGTVSREDEVRYQTLVDLAAFLSDYGLPSVASAALRLVETAAPEPQVRRHARLNLFFLAARHEEESAFTALRLALANEPLTPRQQTQYALFAAQGFRRFAQFDAAQASAERAVHLANGFQLFQFAFEAEAELREIESVRSTLNRTRGARSGRSLAATNRRRAADASVTTPYTPETRTKIPPRIRRVAESIESMAAERFAVSSELEMGAAL
ncbi:MAG TPA: hypothetical protein VII66_02070, partial [Gemmatimonadaceae bacterium]